jgi:hypothetical protein
LLRRPQTARISNFYANRNPLANLNPPIDFKRKIILRPT